MNQIWNPKMSFGFKHVFQPGNEYEASKKEHALVKPLCLMCCFRFSKPELIQFERTAEHAPDSLVNLRGCNARLRDVQADQFGQYS